MASNPFDQFDPAPAEANPFDRFDKPAKSALAEIGTQFKAGALADVPEVAGKAVQRLATPGSTAYNLATQVRQYGEAQAARPDLQPEPDRHGGVVNALAGAARVVPSIAAPIAAGAAIAAAAPEAGAGALIGSLAGSAAGAAPFALSAGQETYEKAKAQGVSEDEANAAANQNELAQGAIMALGGHALGSIVKGAGGVLAKSLGKSPTVESALSTFTAPKTVMPFVKSIPETAATNVALFGGQAAAGTAIEQAHGIQDEQNPDQTPLGAAADQVPVALGMTALLGPLAALGFGRSAMQRAAAARALADPTAKPDVRQKAADQVASTLAGVDKDAAATWAANAAQGIREGKPIGMTPDWTQGAHPDLFKDITGGPPQLPPPPPDNGGNGGINMMDPAEVEAAQAQRNLNRANELARRAALPPDVQRQVWGNVIDKDGNPIDDEKAQARADAGLPADADQGGALTRTAAAAVDQGAAAKPFSAPEAFTPRPEVTAPPDLQMQNRDRSRPGSIAQMQAIANAPDYDRLGPGKSPNEAAPLVSVAANAPTIPETDFGGTSRVVLGDGSKMPFRYAVVDADDVLASHNADGSVNGDYFSQVPPGTIRALNNGRTAALQAAYQRGTADDYKAAMLADVGTTGIDPKAIEGKKAPMLVRVYDDAENARPNMGALSNPQSNLKASVPEQAQNDARNLDTTNLKTDEKGSFITPENDNAIKQFLATIPLQEQNDLVGKDGPTTALAARIKAAVFAKAYGNPDLVTSATEARDPDVKNILHALTIAAPEFSRVDHQGNPMDVRPALVEATGIIRNARNRGMPMSFLLGTDDVLGRDPMTQAMVEFMVKNARSPKRMGEAFSEMARFTADEQKASTSTDMFGRGQATMADLTQRVNTHLEKLYGPETAVAPAEEGPPPAQERQVGIKEGGGTARAAPAADRGQQGENGRAATGAVAKYAGSADVAKLEPAAQKKLLELVGHAEKLKPAYDKKMQGIADAIPGAKAHLPALKGPERASEKILTDYNGDASQIKDILRGSIEVPNLDGVHEAIAAVKKQFDVLPKGARNLFDPKIQPEDGYRDAKFNALMDGHVVEIQVNFPELLAAKKSKGHDLYEKREALMRQAVKDNRPPTPQERAAIDELNGKMRALYDPIYAAAFAETSERKAASETGAPLRVIEPGSNARGGETSKAAQGGAEPQSQATGIPSTSKNLAESGNLAGRGEGFIGNSNVPQSSQVDIAKHPIIRALSQKRDNMRAFRNADNTVPIDDLVSEKDQTKDAKLAAGGADPRLRAAGYMVRAIAGGKEPREPLTVRQRPDGKYDVIDGNATVQAAKLAGWTKLPVEVQPGAAQEGVRAFQAAQTETPAFKAWFGKSKVVLNEGEPLVVYRGEHGESDEEFHTRSGSLTFSWRGAANHYATYPNDGDLDKEAKAPRVAPVYLRIEKPILDDAGDPFIDVSILENALGKKEALRIARKNADAIHNTNNWHEINAKGEYLSVGDFLDKHPERAGELYFEAYHVLDDADSVAKLKAAGYDGAIYEGSGETAGEAEYRVFDKSQVKSAIGNSGAFDKTNPSIVREGFGLKGAPEQGELFKSVQAFVEKSVAALPKNSLQDTPKARSAREAALRELTQAGRLNVLAASINLDMIRTGKVDLLGQRVTSPADMAAVAQVYRDPRFETMRYILTKNGQVVHETAVSARLPGTTPAFVGEYKPFVRKIHEAMQAVGADGIYIMHNHPSGVAEASPADITLTKFLAPLLPFYKGHIIIDTNQYSVIDKKGVATLYKADFGGAQPHLKNGNVILGREVTSASTIAEIGKTIQNADNVAVIAIGASGRVVGLAEVAPTQISNGMRTIGMLNRFSRATGAGGGVFLANVGRMEEHVATDLVRSGIIREAITADRRSVLKSLRQAGAPVKNYVYAGRDAGTLPARHARQKDDVSGDLFGDANKVNAERERAVRKASPAMADAYKQGSSQIDLFGEKVETPTTGAPHETSQRQVRGNRPAEPQGEPAGGARADGGERATGTVPAQREQGGEGLDRGRAPAQPGSGDAAGRSTDERGVGHSAGSANVPEPGGSGSVPQRMARPRAYQVPDKPGVNFRVTRPDELGAGGVKQKYADNVAAITLLKKIESENRLATPAEQEVLAKFVGWGGLKNAFFHGTHTSITEGLKERSGSWQRDRLEHGQAADFAPQRRELHGLLTPEEYETARASTPNAHYTAPQIIRGMWDAVQAMGFKEGRILEPALGVGHFFGLMPDRMLGQSKLAGVELDSISARIAKQLYQKADIREGGFQDAHFPKGYFDLAISNVPFGDFKVHDPEFNKHNLLIHDYFFAKALDRVRPGGIVAFITSDGTMDKINSNARQVISRTGEFVGAVRLPNDAFKKNAGTEVTTDIIFMRKRAPGETGNREPWLETQEVKTADGPVEVNEYYAKHPEMILGKLGRQGSMYGADDRAVTSDGRDLPRAMADAFRTLPKVYEPLATTKKFVEPIPDTAGIKVGSLTIKNGKVYQKNGGGMLQAQDLPVEKVQALIGVRDAARATLTAQVQSSEDAPFMAAAKVLNTAYDAFVRKHGYINERANIRVAMADADGPLLASLEKWNRETGKATKADIFTKRTVSKQEPVASVGSPEEEWVLSVSLNERGHVDLEHMAKITGLTEAELIGGLEGRIYHNPITRAWEDADGYLSGNVRRKLSDSQAAEQSDPRYRANTTALKAVQPVDIPPTGIRARLGQTWIPKQDLQAFAREITGAGTRGRVEIDWSPATADWRVRISNLYDTPELRQIWGTNAVDSREILEAALNQQKPKVYRTENGERVIDKEATLAAAEKVDKMREHFETWWRANPERAERMAALYNTEYNTIRLRQYDGAHLTLPGTNPLIDLRKNVKDGAWRIVSGGNTLLAHAVGAGKTFTAITGSMELKRLGLAKKPMHVVLGSTLDQYANDWMRLYPNANVLIARKEDFSSAQARKTFVAKVATGNWDGVVIAHQTFGAVAMSPEYQAEYMRQQLAEMEDAYLEAKADKADPRLLKRLEKKKKAMEARLRKMLAAENKDDLVSFEELGVDRLFVDEAHYFKNLGFTTKMDRIAGISQTESQRATDMLLKTRYVSDLNNGDGGLVFMTGTPISNSVTEMYTMQRYLGANALKESHLDQFDNWAAQFGEAVTQYEMRADGGGYAPKTRFAKFVNMGELAQMFGAFADVKTPEMLKLPVPAIVGGKPEIITAPKTDAMQAFVESLVARAEAVKSGQVDPTMDNMLKITSDGRKAALDMRLVDPAAEDRADSKVNKVVDRIYQMYQQSAKTKGLQLVFSDLSTPHAGKFSVYQDMKDKLVKRGVPAGEVAFVQTATSDAKRDQMFEAAREGRIRVMFGSTDKMGTGVNVQRNLVAMHHLDVPWRPSDVEQRNGRGIRQGNVNPEVLITHGVTEGSFDAFMWGTVERKAGFIGQAMRADPTVREIEEVDARPLTYAELKAFATGNPLILEKANVDGELQRLTGQQARYQEEQYVLAKRVVSLGQKAESLRAYAAAAADDQRALVPTYGDAFSMTIGDRPYGDRVEAANALSGAMSRVAADLPQPTILGKLGGMDIAVQPRSSFVRGVTTTRLFAIGRNTYQSEAGESADGNIMRLENLVRSIAGESARATAEADDAEKGAAAAREASGKPFEKAAQVEALLTRQREIDRELGIGQDDAGAGAEDEGEAAGEGEKDNGDVPSVASDRMNPEIIEPRGPLANVPPNNKWRTDPGVMPGEPELTYGDHQGAIVEIQPEGSHGIIYEGVLDGGQSVGRFSTMREAAKAVEKAVGDDYRPFDESAFDDEPPGHAEAGAFEYNPDAATDEVRAAQGRQDDPGPPKNERPDWVKGMDPRMQEALRKSGVWAPKKTLKERYHEYMEDWGLKVVQGAFDQFAPVLKRLGEYPYKLLRMASSYDAGLESALFHGHLRVNAAGALDTIAGTKGLLEILKPLHGEVDRFLSWVAGNRAETLQREEREHLFGDTDIAQLKTLNRKLHDKDDFPDGHSAANRAIVYAKVLADYNAFSKSILDIAEKNGIIDGAKRAMWERQFYVPFFREQEEGKQMAFGNVSGMVNQYAFKKLKGGTGVLHDLLANTMQNWSHLLQASLKNHAAQVTLEKAAQLGAARVVPEAIAPKGSVFILDKGKKVYYVVDDPLLLDAISSLETTPFKGPAMKAMSTFKHLLTAGVTLSPTFRIRNVIRDQIQALAVNPTSYNFIRNMLDGFKYSSKNNPDYGHMLAGGAFIRMGQDLGDRRAAYVKRLIAEGIDDATILDSPDKVKTALGAAWDWWKETGERSEAITRANLYKQTYDRLIREGAGADQAHFEASYVARDSMDFGLHGVWPAVRMLTQVVPFMNARLQGLYKLGRGAKEDPKRFAAVIGGVTLATIGLSLLYRDDKDFQDREEWDRDNYWWFKVGDKAFRIPKPFEVGALATVIDRGLDAALNGFGKEDRARFANSLLSNVANQLNMNPVPQAVWPAIELWANQDSFTNRKIESEHDANLSTPNRIGANTSATAIALGKLGVLSPEQIDFLANAYFGWVGAHAIATADLALRPAMGLPTQPARRTDQYFVVGDFVKDLPSTQSRFVERFYTHLQDVQQAFGDLRQAQKLGQTDKVKELAGAGNVNLLMERAYMHASREMGKLNTQIRVVQAKDMDPTEKRNRITALTDQRNKLAETIETNRARIESGQR